MILATVLLACGTQTTDPDDPPVDAVPSPPLSTLGVDTQHDATSGVTFSDHPEVGGWSLNMALSGFGRQNLQPVGSAVPVEDGDRVAYQRNGFTDWFEQRDEGTKHGIDVTERPSGTAELRFEYTVLSNLTARQDDDGIRFVDANGQVLFHYMDLVTLDANGDQLPSRMELDCSGPACTIELVVDDTDAVYPINIDPLAFSNENVLISPPGVADFGVGYGFSVDVDGDFAIVGAPLVDTGGNNRGAAYIYTRSGNSWNLSATLAGQDNGDQCGRGVAISADRAVIGCPTAEDAGGQANRGLARVYVFDSVTWNLETELFGPNVNNQRMGWSVDLNESGDRAIVGGWGSSGNEMVGAVTIYERAGSTWTSAGNFTPTGIATVDRFGFSVGISDDHAIVGAPRTTVSGNTLTGRAYFYDRIGANTWAESTITSVVDGPNANSRFGYSVATADNTSIIGAPLGTGGGLAVVYDFAAGNWNLTQTLSQLQPDNTDRFGRSVGINGNSIAVGASRDDSATTDDRNVGSVVVFDLVLGVWEEQVELLTRDERLDNDADPVRNGWDVAISGDWVITGSNPTTNQDSVELETAHLFQLTFCTAQTDQPGCDVDLVITEVHPQPNTGTYGEQFIELYNAGTSAVQLIDADIFIGPFSFAIDDSFVIGPDQHAVIAQSDDSTVNGGIAGIPGVYVPSSTTWSLDPEEDTISVLGIDGSTLATMSYSGFASPASSLQLDHDGVNYADPSDPYTATTAGNWCPTFLPYAEGGGTTDFMSPRLENEACGVTFTFDYEYVIDTGAVPPPDAAAGSTYITVTGNQFISGNGGEGPVVYTATATGQTLSITYAGPFTILDSIERGFDESCYSGFIADPSTTTDDDYTSGSFFNLVCTNP